MKLNALKIKLSLLLLFAATLCARPQGTFVNLDFESANIPPGTPPGTVVAVSDALPGWTCYIGTNQVTAIHYDDISLGAAAITIHDRNSFEPILQGNYTVLLQGSFPDGQIVPA